MYEKSAVVISLFFHLLIFELIVLTFPLKPVAHKPMFIFLGSILNEEETLPVVIQTQKHAAQQHGHKTVIRSPSAFLPESSTSMIKPFYQAIVPQNSKEYLKSSFLDLDDPTARMNFLKKLGIPSKPPTYSPLHLDAQ